MLNLRRNAVYAALVPAALLAVLAGCASDSDHAADKAAPPEVNVVTLSAKPMRVTRGLPGRTSAYRIAYVRPQVSGLIEERLFEEGNLVVKGQPLYRIDSAAYRAAYESANAELLRAQAEAQALESRASRLQSLIARNVVSQQDLDDAVAAAEQARAEIAAAEAVRNASRIELDRTVVRAPIAGRIGRSLVTEGGLVTANQEEELSIITTLDPIYVDLSQTSADLLRRKRRQTASPPGSAPEIPPVTLSLEDGSVYPHKGVLEFSEVRVNSTTGGMVVRALFPNPDGTLLPGMFVTAEIYEGMREDALLVPQRAVMRNVKGDGYVYVVTADNVVEQHAVVIERAIGSDWLVSGGVSPGQRVMVAGFQYAEPGDVVKPVELPPARLATDAASTPQPAAVKAPAADTDI